MNLKRFCYTVLTMQTIQVASAPVRTCPSGSYLDGQNRCRCKYDYAYFNYEGKMVCIPCPDCGPGKGRSLTCNNHGMPHHEVPLVTCVDCPIDYYSDVICRPCTEPCNLQRNEEVLVYCSAYSDWRCRCKKGFYRDISTGVCSKRCSPCYDNYPKKRVPKGECPFEKKENQCLEGAVTPPTTAVSSISSKCSSTATNTSKNISSSETSLITSPDFPKFENNTHTQSVKKVLIIICISIIILLVVGLVVGFVVLYLRWRRKKADKSEMVTLTTEGDQEMTRREELEIIQLPDEVSGQEMTATVKQEPIQLPEEVLEKKLTEFIHTGKMVDAFDNSKHFNISFPKIAEKIFGYEFETLIQHYTSFDRLYDCIIRTRDLDLNVKTFVQYLKEVGREDVVHVLQNYINDHDGNNNEEH